MQASSAADISQQWRRRARHRLIGVAALLLLAVLVLPMLLDDAPRRSVRTTPQMNLASASVPVAVLTVPVAPVVPPKVVPAVHLAANPDVNRAIPAPSVGAAASAKVMGGVGAPSAELAAEQPVAGKSTAVVGARAASSDVPHDASLTKKQAKHFIASKTARQTSKSAAGAVAAQQSQNNSQRKAHQSAHVNGSPASEQYFVQLGVFRQPDHVASLRKNVQGLGMTVHTETLSSGSVRLRLGPYASRKKAEAVLGDLRLNNIDAQLVPVTH